MYGKIHQNTKEDNKKRVKKIPYFHDSSFLMIQLISQQESLQLVCDSNSRLQI